MNLSVLRRNWLALTALAAAECAALLTACGCKELLGGPEKKSLVRLNNGCLLVLPFATPNKKHFESEIGKGFSGVVAQLVRDGCPLAKVLDADDLPAAVDGQALDQLSVVAVGQALGAKYVAVGEIHDLRAKEPGSYKVLRGTMAISARVFDVNTGSLVWRCSQQRFHYPQLVGGEVIPAQTDNEEEVIRRVMKEAAWAVAAVFRGPRSDEEIRLAE